MRQNMRTKFIGAILIIFAFVMIASILPHPKDDETAAAIARLQTLVADTIIRESL